MSKNKIFNKTSQLFITGLTGLTGLSVAGHSSAAEAQKPNFIFILADDLGWGDISCHGHPHIKTPNIDRLAAEGTDYQFFTVAGASCSPSRTGLLTGLCPARFNMNYALASHAINSKRNSPDFLDVRAVTLPRLLKERGGYATAHFGKWHLSNEDAIPFAPLPVEYGYDRTGVWNGGGPNIGDGITKSPEYDREHPSAFVTEAAVMQTIKFITENRDRPFFVNLWIHESHTKIEPTDAQKEAYMQYDEPYRSYYACIGNADRLLGRLFDWLREAGLEEKTIIVFCSDNGPEVPSENPKQITYYSRGSTGGLRGAKRSLFQGGTGVPFIVKWKGHYPAGKVDSISQPSALDILPTFCELAGVALPDGFTPDGESITALLKGDPWNRKKPLFWHGPGERPDSDEFWAKLCIERGPYKLYMNSDATRIELYNVLENRSENVNLAERYPEKAQEMKKDLLAWAAALPEHPDPVCVIPKGAEGSKKKAVSE